MTLNGDNNVVKLRDSAQNHTVNVTGTGNWIIRVGSGAGNAIDTSGSNNVIY